MITPAKRQEERLDRTAEERPRTTHGVKRILGTIRKIDALIAHIDESAGDFARRLTLAGVPAPTIDLSLSSNADNALPSQLLWQDPASVLVFGTVNAKFSANANNACGSTQFAVQFVATSTSDDHQRIELHIGTNDSETVESCLVKFHGDGVLGFDHAAGNPLLEKLSEQIANLVARDAVIAARRIPPQSPPSP